MLLHSQQTQIAGGSGHRDSCCTAHSIAHACHERLTQGTTLQEDLIGQERDKAGDERQRAKLHQQWLEQQDAQQVAQLLEGVRNGFRRKRAGDLLDENVSTCFNIALFINNCAMFPLVTAQSSHCAVTHQLCACLQLYLHCVSTHDPNICSRTILEVEYMFPT